MGYFENYCQLCGVSFAIARIRRADEPQEAAWDYCGTGFVDHEGRGKIEDTCGPSSDCSLLAGPGRFLLQEESLEHIAGPTCASGLGYTGHHISLQEMEGCRAIQCLVKKKQDWQPEEDDQDFELTSNYFLTGVGDGSPDEAPLQNIRPARHGLNEVWVSNYNEWSSHAGLPFHPTCFEIFKRVSLLRFGKVDVHGLWEWREHECSYDGFIACFPHDYAVKDAREQWWYHTPGEEYLAANPIAIPFLPVFLDRCELARWGPNPRGCVYHSHYSRRDKKVAKSQQIRPPASPSADPFMHLPQEIKQKVLEHCSSKDIANLRLVSRAFEKLDVALFRRLLIEDMPWLWEVREMSVGKTDWCRVYCQAKFHWPNLKGVKNRKRIWKDVQEIVTRIERYRSQGVINDD